MTASVRAAHLRRTVRPFGLSSRGLKIPTSRGSMWTRADGELIHSCVYKVLDIPHVARENFSLGTVLRTTKRGMSLRMMILRILTVEDTYIHLNSNYKLRILGVPLSDPFCVTPSTLSQAHTATHKPCLPDLNISYRRKGHVCER